MAAQTDVSPIPPDQVVQPVSQAALTLSGHNVVHQVHHQAYAEMVLVPALRVAILVFLIVEYAKLNGVEIKFVMPVKPVAHALQTVVAAILVVMDSV